MASSFKLEVRVFQIEEKISAKGLGSTQWIRETEEVGGLQTRQQRGV